MNVDTLISSMEKDLLELKMSLQNMHQQILKYEDTVFLLKTFRTRSKMLHSSWQSTYDEVVRLSDMLPELLEQNCQAHSENEKQSTEIDFDLVPIVSEMQQAVAKCQNSVCAEVIPSSDPIQQLSVQHEKLMRYLKNCSEVNQALEAIKKQTTSSRTRSQRSSQSSLNDFTNTRNHSAGRGEHRNAELTSPMPRKRSQYDIDIDEEERSTSKTTDERQARIDVRNQKQRLSPARSGSNSNSSSSSSNRPVPRFIDLT